MKKKLLSTLSIMMLCITLLIPILTSSSNVVFPTIPPQTGDEGISTLDDIPPKRQG